VVCSMSQRNGVEDEEHNAAETEEYAEDLLPCDRLLEEDSRNEHREDRRDGADDGGVDGCCNGDGFEESQLRDEESEE